jgi:hypothetical protein
MSTVQDIPELERIQFFTGQRLTAADLSELQRANRELRWLHNRSLHGWGIGLGFGVTGERGDTAVTVAPGYAIDCRGREIILTESVTLPVPAVAADDSGAAAVYYLTATYRNDASQDVAEQRPGVCLPGGTVRLTEAPAIAWRAPGDVEDGINIILAKASILNCQLDAPLSLEVRRPARPSQQPYLAAGQVEPLADRWQLKLVNGDPIALTTDVDTSAARFAVTPTYFAHIVGPRVVTDPATGQQRVAIGFTAITGVTPDRFTCEVYLLKGDVATSGFQQLSATELKAHLGNDLHWTIAWMGVEG